ncbi:MAG: hypothetical protein P8K08_19600 [Fuerstiella sp.]|jgi:hypothetical protein|nr:hypothetical protein [Fuerstiella sp.]
MGLLTIRATRQSTARHLLDSALRSSSLYNLLWVVRGKRLQREPSPLGVEALDSRKMRFRHQGPRESSADDGDAQQAAIDLWERSSIPLDESCQATGCLYVHVLQPNQYFAGSQILKPREEKVVRTATGAEMEQGQCVDIM